MRAVKVTFADGNSLITSINGTDQEIRDYYVGQTFNLGEDEATGEEYKVKAVAVEVLT